MKFEYSSVVIGSDLKSFLFAFVNDYPILFTEQNKPHQFDFFVDYHNDNSNKFISFDKIYKFGKQKIYMWERLYFLLSMRGLLPLSDMCDTIRYDGKKLICSTEYSKLCEIKFNNCFYGGDNKTYKLINLKEPRNVRYKVYDKIAFTSGGKHDIDYFETDDDFVNKVWFFSSDRICGNTGVKDAYVLSTLTHEQLNSPSYTNTMARFKLLSIMKENGMRGKQNGFTKNGTPRHYNFKVHNIERKIISLNLPLWSENETVKRINDSIPDLLEQVSPDIVANYEYLDGNKL
tara:strand:+ start:13167 stop:14033 length:867 start_codon:yes stop_codon:yes gene_type:complete